MGKLGERGQIAGAAEDAGILHDDAGGLGVDVLDELRVRRGRQRHDLMLGIAADGLDHGAVMRMQIAEQHRFLPPRDAVRHQHGLGGRGRAVIHGGVGHLHAGERRHLGLELEQILQRALRDLRLIGRIGGHEFRPLDDVIDGCRNVMLIGAAAGKERHRAGGRIPRRQPAERPLDGHLALVLRQAGDAVQQQAFRHVGEQLVDLGDADRGKHLAALIGRMGEIPHYSMVSR